MTVLIVDDSLVVRKMIENNLSGLGLKVAGKAANGREALEMFDGFKPELVTLDITMPEMDGLQVLKALKEKDPGVNVIIISALKDKDTGVQALKMGARAFLVKPFSAEQLREEVESIQAGGI